MCDIIISSKLFNFKKDISVYISKIELNEYNVWEYLEQIYICIKIIE